MGAGWHLLGYVGTRYSPPIVSRTEQSIVPTQSYQGLINQYLWLNASWRRSWKNEANRWFFAR
eukprot:scaffold14144_cov91-Skeletonema_dohrnii-CCMP3373.AAC.10